MSEQTEQPRCDGCRHWRQQAHLNGPDRGKLAGFGLCYRFPPTPYQRHRSRHPATTPADWCGEYAPALNQGGDDAPAA